MRIRSNTQVAIISVLCGVVFTASAAVAQTTSSSTNTQTKSSDTGVKAMQAQKPSSATNSDDFFGGLMNLPTQSKAGFNPTVGATVPDDVTLHPIPSLAAEAMPSVKDHHVAKMDGNTAVIADPKTRKITHVVSSSDSTASTSGSSKTDPGSSTSSTGSKSSNGTSTTSGSGDTGSTSTGSGSNGSK